MPQCHVRIGRKDDPGPLFPEFAGKVIHASEVSHVGVLEAGMVSGKASLVFYIPLADGSLVFAQTSADILRGILAAADAVTPPA